MFNKLLTLGALILTVTAFGAYWYFAGRLGISNKGSDWANFGSYISGIFSGLAFLILIYQNSKLDKEQKEREFNDSYRFILNQLYSMTNQLNIPYENKVKTVFDLVNENDKALQPVYMDRIQPWANTLFLLLSLLKENNVDKSDIRILTILSSYSERMKSSLEKYTETGKHEKAIELLEYDNFIQVKEKK